MKTETMMNIKVRQLNPPNGLLEALSRAKLDCSSPAELFYSIWLGGANYCGAFGVGDNGAYEWFTWCDCKLETSNVGYGSIEIALRDVLNKVA